MAVINKITRHSHHEHVLITTNGHMSTVNLTVLFLENFKKGVRCCRINTWELWWLE